MTRLIVLRPEPGARATAARATAMGFEPVVAPLFTIRAVRWPPPATPPQALMMTSANAARLGGKGLDALTHLPLYAVGTATAAAARDAGFGTVIPGEGDAAAIAAIAARDGVTALLHLAGREHRAVAVAGVSIETRIAYAADALDALPPGLSAAGAIALVHSPRAAAVFARLVRDRGDVRLAAISEAARNAAGDGWRAVAVATRPTDAALLAAAAKLCDQ